MKGRVLGALLAAAVAGGGLLAWRARVDLVSSRLSVREFVSGLAEVQPDLRLVVARVDLVKTMTGESAKNVMGLDLGVTRAMLTVPGRVHYALDLTAPEPVAFRFDRDTRILAVEFPPVSVLSAELFWQDKATVVEPGWGRLRDRSGRALEQAMESKVYESVKRDASEPAALAAAREKARPVLTRLIEGYLSRAGLLRVENGVAAVAVRFRDDPTLESASR
ncbi:MAG: DUF4230 domain-containing protein [Elusimicrobia bacterium]|nr:DUF4230 domain-containing protein [Elusimicrobiota bacterium]